MAIVLRKAGAAPVKITPPTKADQNNYRSPFKESFHAEQSEPTKAAQPTTYKVEEKPRNSEAPSVTPPPVVATTVKPKAIFKVTGGRPIKPAMHPTTSSTADLATAGLFQDQPDPMAESKLRWPPCAVGTRVRVTNSMFPWVKHYKPGDECIVESIPPNMTMAEDPWKYKSHLLRIVSPESSRKGHTIMLFRWEFEPVPENRVRMGEGRIITQT